MSRKMRWRRRMGAVMLSVGVPLCVVAAGPMAWGFGVLVAVSLVVGGVAALTDEGE